MRKITTLAVVLVGVVSISSSAEARTIAPPGNSEADQYFETLPGSTGPRAPAVKKTAENAVNDGQLDESTARALDESGATGEALGEAVAMTAPASDRGGGAGGAGSAAEAAVPPPAEHGLGVLFFPILAIAAIACGAFFVRRRRLSRR